MMNEKDVGLDTASGDMPLGDLPSDDFQQALLHKQALLQARARELAREMEPEQAGEARIEIVEFQLAHEHYAVETAYVREVYPLKEITPLPCTPAYVLGILNVRGQILPVIDIKTFFDLPGEEVNDLYKIIILREGEMEFGVLADRILGVRFIELHQLQASLPTLTGIRAEYLRGVTNERLVILDASRLLNDEKLIVHEEVAA